MNAERLAAMLDKVAGSGVVVMCQYCGALTPTLGNLAICHSCESAISRDGDALARRSADMVEAIGTIKTQLAAYKYDDAMASYEALYAKYGDPALLYAEGLVCNACSNHEVSLISYAREGFMEENTLHRDEAARRAARARLLFNKSLNAYTAALEKESSPATMYMAFLAHIKLGNLRAAESMLDGLAGSGSHYLHAYAKIVFNSASGRFGELAADAERLMKPDLWSVNAFYYMALALLKAHDSKAALKLVRALKKHIGGSAVEALEKEAVNYDAATLF